VRLLHRPASWGYSWRVVDLERFADAQLIEYVHGFADAGPDSDALTAALNEVFRRMREEATPEKREYVEAVIARLTWTFSQRDDDGGSGDAGVREPRRPFPPAGSLEAAVECPAPYGEAA
jgi:hypothetical protein